MQLNTVQNVLLCEHVGFLYSIWQHSGWGGASGFRMISLHCKFPWQIYFNDILQAPHQTHPQNKKKKHSTWEHKLSQCLMHDLVLCLVYPSGGFSLSAPAWFDKWPCAYYNTHEPQPLLQREPDTTEATAISLPFDACSTLHTSCWVSQISASILYHKAYMPRRWIQNIFFRSKAIFCLIYLGCQVLGSKYSCVLTE